MISNNQKLEIGNWISDLKHLLPEQSPLKDFVHHNTLHAFQHLDFFVGLESASRRLGYETLMSISWFKNQFEDGKINNEILIKLISENQNMREMGILELNQFLQIEDAEVFHQNTLRGLWKRYNGLDLDATVHPLLFRTISNYLDQGISELQFVHTQQGFLHDIIQLEKNSWTSMFKSKKTSELLFRLAGEETLEIIFQLLDLVVGDSNYFRDYLLEQQLLHPGWSGLINQIHYNQQLLTQLRKIELEEMIAFELLLEVDAINAHAGYKSLAELIYAHSELLDHSFKIEYEIHDLNFKARIIWQQALEWTHYSQVISALKHHDFYPTNIHKAEIQALFCIDDREGSIRRNLEQISPEIETFGTPGFFGLEFYFKPSGAIFNTKSCPAPITPQFLIKEVGGKSKHQSDIHFSKRTHSLLLGWLITHSVAFWAVFRLILQVFRPKSSRYSADSTNHMDENSKLTVFSTGQIEDNLKVGFTPIEAADRLEGLLRSVGLVNDFCKNIYLVSHGASSVNNPHYAAYDCGACCGRPGSVNARAMAEIANDLAVRNILEDRGIVIPLDTKFIGMLHDTTKDVAVYYDVLGLTNINKTLHELFTSKMRIALDNNAVERSRKFELINPYLSHRKIIKSVQNRSVSLFEPRPELNHATNSLCIIGPREFSKNIFLDRRAFLNSYNPTMDLNGDLLFGIVKAAAPVCGGINLEYYFSRVDNLHFGAGSKLPHNVMGLIGVANGADGDLRPGLPSQMIEVHEPVRLLMIIQQERSIVESAILRDQSTAEWFLNQWIHLVVCEPSSGNWYQFQKTVSNYGTISHFMPLDSGLFTENIPESMNNEEVLVKNVFPSIAILN